MIIEKFDLERNTELLFEFKKANAKSDITVNISLFNYEEYIEECLESVKSQILNDINLIVVDDYSIDNSVSVTRRWLEKNKERFNECLFIQHKQNFGLPYTRNTALSYTKSDYVFILDADNLLYPRCLSRLLSALRNCDASFSYCLLEEFGSENGIRNKKPWNPDKLATGNPIDAMVLHRKDILNKVGGYSIMPVMGWEDYDLWFKIARIKGWGIQVPEILARYRIHKKSMLNKITNPNVEKLWDYLKSTYPEFFR